MVATVANFDGIHQQQCFFWPLTCATLLLQVTLSDYDRPLKTATTRGCLLVGAAAVIFGVSMLGTWIISPEAAHIDFAWKALLETQKPAIELLNVVSVQSAAAG